MISSDPRLPQLTKAESEGAVLVAFLRRFQERFYSLWRGLAFELEKSRRNSELAYTTEVITSGTSWSWPTYILKAEFLTGGGGAGGGGSHTAAAAFYGGVGGAGEVLYWITIERGSNDTETISIGAAGAGGAAGAAGTAAEF